MSDLPDPPVDLDKMERRYRNAVTFEDRRILDLIAALRSTRTQLAEAEHDANEAVEDRNRWQHRISTALDLVYEEMHGGGASIPADLDKCVERILELQAERQRGWEAAYQRGRSTRTAVPELEAEIERLRNIIQPNEPDQCCANRHPDVWTGEVCLTCPDRLRRPFDA